MHHIEKLNIFIVHDRTMRQGGAGIGENGGIFRPPLKNIGTHINLAVIARHEKNVENCDAISCADSILKMR
ncbi:MAG: hypothetical protein WCY95_05495 [Castellaniella sp.]